MIGHISGILFAKNPPQLIINAGGIGYEVDVPMSTFYTLPVEGETVSLYTHFLVREDGQFLFGFASESERQTFRQLIKVSGIGARTALAILSGLSVQELSAAIANQESGRLIKIPGIGKKTAERLLLELRDKLSASTVQARSSAGATPIEAQDALTDIRHALLALGYNEREASAAMKDLPEDSSVAEGIRHALKKLSKN